MNTTSWTCRVHDPVQVWVLLCENSCFQERECTVSVKAKAQLEEGLWAEGPQPEQSLLLQCVYSVTMGFTSISPQFECTAGSLCSRNLTFNLYDQVFFCIAFFNIHRVICLWLSVYKKKKKKIDKRYNGFSGGGSWRWAVNISLFSLPREVLF